MNITHVHLRCGALLAAFLFTRSAFAAPTLTPDSVLSEAIERATAIQAEPQRRHGCGSQIVRDAQAVLPAMNDAQLQQLQRLGPIYRRLVERERARRSGMTVSALPSHPQLTETRNGPNSVVHYSLTAPGDAAPNLDYVKA